MEGVPLMLGPLLSIELDPAELHFVRRLITAQRGELAAVAQRAEELIYGGLDEQLVAHLNAALRELTGAAVLLAAAATGLDVADEPVTVDLDEHTKEQNPNEHD